MYIITSKSANWMHESVNHVKADNKDDPQPVYTTLVSNLLYLYGNF